MRVYIYIYMGMVRVIIGLNHHLSRGLCVYYTYRYVKDD